MRRYLVNCHFRAEHIPDVFPAAGRIMDHDNFCAPFFKPADWTRQSMANAFAISSLACRSEA